MEIKRIGMPFVPKEKREFVPVHKSIRKRDRVEFSKAFKAYVTEQARRSVDQSKEKEPTSENPEKKARILEFVSRYAVGSEKIQT